MELWNDYNAFIHEMIQTGIQIWNNSDSAGRGAILVGCVGGVIWGITDWMKGKI